MEAGMEAGRARGLRRVSELGCWVRRRVLVALELVLQAWWCLAELLVLVLLVDPRGG